VAARRQVARYLREAGDLPLFIAQRGDDGVGPEALPVFADAPPFVFDAPLTRGGFELAPRLFRREVIRTVEHGEMLPDGLVLAVPHDPPRAAVP